MCTVANCEREHRPPYTFVWPDTTIVVDTDARCHRCSNADHLIAGDGVVVCWRCLNVLAETATDPLYASPTLRGILAELHADVVTLRELAGSVALEWTWTAKWPAAGDLRLVGGGVAA